MVFFLVVLLALGATSIAADEQRIPRELLRRDKLPDGGGWGLSISTCPLQTRKCSSVNVSNSSVCVGSLLGDSAEACRTNKPVASFCQDASWPTWWLPDETDLAYFCCMEGQIENTSGYFVSSLKVIVSSLKDLFVSANFQRDRAEASPASEISLDSSTTTPSVGRSKGVIRPWPGSSKDSEATPPRCASEPAGVGMRCEIKNLYQGPGSYHGYTNWVDKYPDDLAQPAESAATAGYALLVRYRRNQDNSKRVLVIDSIVVQSPLLKPVLGSVLERYPGITTGLNRLEFSAPFQPFIHRWDEFLNATEREQDAETKQHLDLLFRTIHGEIQEVLAAKTDLLSHKVMTYGLLGTIFRPGDTIFYVQNGKEACCKLRNWHYGTAAFQITCENVDWSGIEFGWSTQSIGISAFDGTKPITQLEAFPLTYHPAKEAVKEQLIARGKKFVELRGYHYKSYDGMGIMSAVRGGSRNFNGKGRIIIDAQAYNRFSGIYSPPLLPLTEGEQNFMTQRSSNYNNDPIGFGGYGDEIEEEFEPDCPAKEKYLSALTEEQLLLACPVVKGYSMKSKTWAKFSVGLVGDVVWSENAFESLVLPEGHKELVLAFAEGQLRYKKAFDDVIQGKGRGIVMLLAGPPGVGKTLTAESVAENMRVPLYAMSAGDLGLDPDQVESNLSNILELVAKWNAILLLDEADVFLEQRSPHDLERNKLVSIFLRALEYYEGILFLTTNRVQTFDAAFHSRIHVTINYPELSVSSRRHIWGNFLAISGQSEGITEIDLDELARIPINGRQIKNVIKTATLIAMRRNTTLHMVHIETVMRVMENIKV